MLNIKTNIEDDKVLFSFLNIATRNTTFRYINAAGIYTIEDFINSNIENFPNRSVNTYSAVQQIFRYAYLDEDLVFDEIIRKKYDISYRGYSEVCEDLSVIGFATYNPTKINSMLTKYGFDKKSANYVSMETILNSIITCKNEGLICSIANFYINYTHDRTKWKLDDNTLESMYTNSELISIKAKLKVLEALKTDITNQIKDLKEQINDIEEGQKVYRR